jgi:hypothetical protein
MVWTGTISFVAVATVVVLSRVTGLFFQNQLWIPPLRLQVSDCGTFRIMCDVTSVAVFCTESMECFPPKTFRFFFRTFVAIFMAPVPTDISIYFNVPHSLYLYMWTLVFILLPASSCVTFLSAHIATSISIHVFFLFRFKSLYLAYFL